MWGGTRKTYHMVKNAKTTEEEEREVEGEERTKYLPSGQKCENH
jgi:hypothetical protein